MGLPVTLFTSEDSGAPQLPTGGNPTQAEIIAIIKACLVDGYGTKAALGWSVELEDSANAKIAFKNNIADGGSGGILVLQPDGAVAANGKIRFFGCRSFTDFDTYAQRDYYSSIQTNSYQKQWYLIGTSVSFYFVLVNSNVTTMYLSYSNEPGFFAGDIDALLPNDAGRFMVLNSFSVSDSTSTSWSTSLSNLGYDDNQALNLMFDADGHPTNTEDYYTRLPTVSNIVSLADTPDITTTLANIMVVLGSVTSQDRNGVYGKNSNLSPYLRGFLPGLVQTGYLGFKDELWPMAERDFNGVMYRAFRTRVATQFWFNLEAWYD
ncbi:hypothetical protein [Agarivorans gilvus]|uniref:Uncharacterized protein n=1 Tax=Agarivorans gilvus TaxID=680279 RepID=A0ABQ1HX16_9ALTE|nr:hypothetical protein [Agarivorans gilvus]GGA95742.1 hypothetical protein GCM10007414_05700 [Agarivorans gilvus]